jgi:hypothetical protein
MLSTAAAAAAPAAQAYLMFGDEEYLSMFTELYVATMRHMQVRTLLPEGHSCCHCLLRLHMLYISCFDV